MVYAILIVLINCIMWLKDNTSFFVYSIYIYTYIREHVWYTRVCLFINIKTQKPIGITLKADYI